MGVQGRKWGGGGGGGGRGARAEWEGAYGPMESVC